MPATAHYRLRQKDSLGMCRCSAHTGPGDLGWPNQLTSYTAKCSDGGWQRRGESKTVTVPAGTYHAETLAGANSLALTDARLQAQALLDCATSMVFHHGVPRRVKYLSTGKVLCVGNWNFLQTLEGDTLGDNFLWPMIYRVNADGSFDDTFLGFSTVVLCDAAGTPLDYGFGASEGVNQAWDLGFDSSGRIYVSGIFLFKVSGVVYNGIARFSADGAFDASFLCRFSSEGLLESAACYALAVVNDNSIFVGGSFDHYAKGNAGFSVTVDLVNIDGGRTVVGAVPIGDVYTTLWPVWNMVYKLGRLYLSTNAPGFEFAGGSGTPPSALNVAGGGIVRVNLSSTGRLVNWRNVASIPYYGPNQGFRVLGIDIDRDGNVYACGLFTAFGKVPLLAGPGGFIGYAGDDVPRLNVVKINSSGTIDPNFHPPVVALGDFPFGIEKIMVLPDRNILILGGAYYVDPSFPWTNAIAKLSYVNGAVLSVYPEMDGIIFGYPWAADVNDAGELYTAGVGGFVVPEAPQGGALAKFRW